MSNFYSAEGGVLLTREVLGNNVTQLDPIFIPKEKFDPPDLKPGHERQSMTYSEDGALGVEILNGESDRLVISAPAWGGSFESPITRLENRSLASCLGDTGIVSYNMPGHGDTFASVPWPSYVRKGLHEGSFLQAGRYVGNFLAQETYTNDNIDVVGFSTGGRVALGIAGALHSPIGNIVLFDPPGSERMSYKQFAQQYRVKEGEHSVQYRQESTDTRLQRLIAQSTRHTRQGILTNIRNGSLIDYYVREPAALARGQLEADLKQANLHPVKRLVFISPEQSELNNVDTVRRILHRTAKKHPNTTVEHMRFSGTHAFTRLGSVALARLYEAALLAPSM